MLNMAVNPLTVTPVLFGLIAAHDNSLDRISPIIVAAVLGYIVLPLSFLVLLTKAGRIESIEARDRRRRAPALWMGAGLLALAGIAVSWTAGAEYGPVSAVAGILLVNALIAAAINERFKISLHVASIAGLFSILTVLGMISGDPMPGGPWVLGSALLLIPLLMWARMADGAHSRNEVLAGCLFGLMVPALELWMVNALGPLYS